MTSHSLTVCAVIRAPLLIVFECRAGQVCMLVHIFKPMSLKLNDKMLVVHATHKKDGIIIDIPVSECKFG